MKSKVKFAVILVSALILCSGSLMAEKGENPGTDEPGGPMHPPRGPMGGPGPHGPFFGDPELMKKKLGLSDEQVRKISGINQTYKNKLEGYHDKIDPKFARLRVLLLEDKVNLKEVRSVMKEISDIDLEIRMLGISHRLDIEKVLTKEQKDKLRNERRNMRKTFPPPPPPPGDDF